MGVPTKCQLLKDIAQDYKDIGQDLCNLQHDHNPCHIKADLTDLIKDTCDLKQDLQLLACYYHCSFSA